MGKKPATPPVEKPAPEVTLMPEGLDAGDAPAGESPPLEDEEDAMAADAGLPAVDIKAAGEAPPANTVPATLVVEGAVAEKILTEAAEKAAAEILKDFVVAATSPAELEDLADRMAPPTQVDALDMDLAPPPSPDADIVAPQPPPIEPPKPKAVAPKVKFGEFKIQVLTSGRYVIDGKRTFVAKSIYRGEMARKVANALDERVFRVL